MKRLLSTYKRILFIVTENLFDTVIADSSPGMLEILKAKISEHGIKNVFPQHLDLHYDLT